MSADNRPTETIIVEDRSRKAMKFNWNYVGMLLTFLIGGAILFMEANTGSSGASALQQQVYALWLIQKQIAVLTLMLFFGIGAIVQGFTR
jgi:hypothetical protein